MRNTGRKLRALWVYPAAVLVVVVIGFPLYGVVLTSIQPEGVIRSSELVLVPTSLDTEHYRDILGAGSTVPLLRAMFNSFVVATATALISVVVAAPASYALTRLRLPGRGAILGVLISLYVFPTILFIIPLYIWVVRIGLVDSYTALVVRYVAFILPLMIWLMKGFLESVPIDVEEAGMIDGANRAQVLRFLVLPLMTPGIVAGFLMAYILSWVEFVTALVFTSQMPILTVVLGLFRSTHDIAVGQLAAAAVLTALPVVALTVLFQKRIVQVITAGADR